MLSVGKVLDEWGLSAFGVPLSDDREYPLVEIPLHEAGDWVDVSGTFDRSCTILVGQGEKNAGGRIRLARIGGGEPPRDNKICLLKGGPGIRLSVGGHGNRIFVGNYGYAFETDIICYNASKLGIGDRSTCNGCRQFLNHSDVVIGVDAMLSDEITVQSTDQHGIVDLATGLIINNQRRVIRIGQHAWIGRTTMLLAGCGVGEGAIVGAASVVKRDVEPFCAFAGVPARLVRRGVSWSRNPARIASHESEFFARYAKHDPTS